MKTNWPTKKLGEIIDFLKGKKMPVTEEERLGYEPYIGIDTLRTREYKLFTPEKNGVKCSKDDVLVVWDGAYAGTVGIEVSGFAGSTVAKVVIREPELDSRFLRYFWEFNGTKIRNAAQGAAIPHLSKPFINNLKVPLPPLETQKQIVERLDKIAEAQKLNNELIQKTDEIFQSLLHRELHPVRYSEQSNGANPTGKDWEVKKLGEICEIYQPKTITSNEILRTGPYKVFGANGVIGYYSKYNHDDAEVLVTCRGATCGTLNMSEPKSWITGNAMVVHPKNEELLLKWFLYYTLSSSSLSRTITGTGQPQITRNSLVPFQIPLPPLEIQKKIVEKLSSVQNYRKQLLEQKIKLKELFDGALYKSFQHS